MAKASAVEMKHTAAVESLSSQMDKLSKGFKRLEDKIEGLTMTSAEGTIELAALEGESGWGISDTEMRNLMSTVEQLCQKAGMSWEAKVADRFSAPAVSAATANPPAPTPAPTQPPGSLPPSITPPEAGKAKGK
jgi:hypothetical protein